MTSVETKGVGTTAREAPPDPFAQPESLLGSDFRVPLHPALGPQRLANFLAAPAATQAEFTGRLARAAATRHLLDHLAELSDEDFIATRGQVSRFAEALGLTIRDAERGRYLRSPEWDVRWRNKAYGRRLYEERGRKVDDNFDGEKARLLAIPAEDYVERLTGEDVPRSGKIFCPLPSHEERTPSCQVRETRWRCYGCQKHGSIYDLAGALWGLDTYGGQFMEIHKRLIEVFP